MREVFELIVCVTAIITGVMVPAFGVAYWGVTVECADYQRITGRQTQLVTITCYVNDGGQWFRWDEYKLRNVTKGTTK